MITTGIEKRVQVQEIIDNQLPEFVLAESPKAADFLKQYYISQEYRGGPIDITDNLDQYLKLDNLTPEVITGRTNLSTDITADAESISVDSTKGYPDQYGLLKIGNEIITYTGKTSTEFTGCIRGFSGITTYRSQDNPEELVFEDTVAATHKDDAIVVNLSSQFLQEFYKKLKVTLTPGLEGVDFTSNLDVNNFIKEARTFYESKGTEESFRILFNVLYNEDPRIIDLEEFLIKPSSARYIRRERIVAEKISGNPLNLTGQTVFKSTDLQTSASISEIELITGITGVTTSEYYALDVFVGYDDEEFVTGTFTVPGRTQVIGDVGAGSSFITVDSTVGFAATGTLVCGINTNIVYSDKTINQFLGISTTGVKSIETSLSYGDLLRSDETIFGYKDGDTTTDKIELRITGVLSKFIPGEDNRLSLDGETIFVKSIGELIKNDGITQKEILSNSWIYNTSTVSQIDLTAVAPTTSVSELPLHTKIDRSSLKVGDTVQILRRQSNPLAQQQVEVFNSGATTAKITGINVSANTVNLNEALTKVANQEYDLRRLLNKASSVVPFKYGDNSITADIQNAYSHSDDYVYIASNGVPSYEITKNISGIGITNAVVGDTVQDYNSTTLKYSTISFASDVPFVTGDAIRYTPGTVSNPTATPPVSPINGITGLSEGTYYVKNEGNNKIKLYLSPSFTAANSNVEFTVTDVSAVYSGGGTVIWTDHEFTLLSQYDKTIASQKLLKKFPLDNRLKSGTDVKTLPGPIGMLINGVEIENYKSTDTIFYGPVDNFSVLSKGENYDVINLPALEVDTSSGTDALVQPVISGHLKEIKVDPQNFDIEDVLSIKITGGNSGNSVVRPVIKRRNRELEFDGRLVNFGGDVDSVNETLRFSNDHNLKSGQALIYNRNGFPALGIGTFGGSNSADYETLEDGATYYPQVLGISSVYLYKDENDYNAGINTIGFTAIAKSGIHKFRLKNAKNTLDSISVVEAGDPYVNRKIYVKPVGVSTFNSVISYDNHGFAEGELIVYSGGATTNITGLSTSVQYKVIKLDNDSFRVANAGVGGTITTNYIKNNYTKFTAAGSGFQSFNYPDITVTADVTYSTGITTERVVLTPYIRGSVIDTFLYEPGTSYGSDNVINYENKPQITLKNGTSRTGKNILPALIPVINNGKIISVNIDDGGAEYYSTPDLIVEGDGTGAELRAVIDRNVGSDTYLRIVEIIIIKGGASYSDENTTIKVSPAGKNALFNLDLRQLPVNNIQTESPYKAKYSNEILTNSEYGLRYATVGYSSAIGSKDGFDDFTGTHSPIIGWAYDGNPIYGPYGYTSPFDSSTVGILTGGYSLNSSNIDNRPDLSIFPAGFFADDYSYDANGDLDEHNGRYCKTPEYPNGVYAYFAGVSTGTSGQLEPKFPYFVGNTYRSIPVVLDPEDTITQSFDFNNSDLVRNTFPYKASDKFAKTYFIESDDIITQTAITNAITQGNVESLEIIKAGDGYKVGSAVSFNDEGTNGNGLSAVIESVDGPTINTIETSYTSFTNVSFIWEKSNKILAYFTEPHELEIGNNIEVSGLSTSIKSLTGTQRIGLTTESTLLYKQVAANSTAGIITDIYVGRAPLISVGSSIGIGTETLSVINKFEDRNILRVRRGVVGSAHTRSTEVKLLPRFATLTVESDYFESELDNIVYFNPKQSIGLGTLAGVGTAVYVSVGDTASSVSVPTQSVYLPNHPFKTGQQVTFTKPSGGGNIGVSSDGLVSSAFSIPESGFSQTLYVINKSDDFIGLVTERNQTSVGNTSSSDTFKGLFFPSALAGSTDNFEYKLESNFTQVTGTVETISALVSVSTSHNLVDKDIINLTLKSDRSVGIGTSTGIKLKYNIPKEKLLINPLTFGSVGVNVLTDTITIASHQFKTGDKVFYNTGVGIVTATESIGGLSTTSSYFVYRIDDNNIQLTNTRYDAINYPPQVISLVSAGGTSQELSLINPSLPIIRNNDIVFDVSDTSLFGYELNFYYDHKFDNEFVSTGTTSLISVSEIGTVGLGTLSAATVTLNYHENNPQNLFYNIEKSGFISTSDVDVKNANKITYVNSEYEGEYSVAGIGTTTFSILLDKKPESLAYNSADSDTLKYSTKSSTARGPINDLDITFGGVGYKKMPRFVSIASSVGSNAQILPRSTSTNKIKDVDILNIGFEYSSDKTLLPIAKLSPVISLRDFGSITKVSIVDGGKGYITDPRIVVVDSATREVNDTGFLQPIVDVNTQSIEDVIIVSSPKGLDNPELFTVDNTNGVSITTLAIGNTIVSNTQSGIVTVTLGTPVLGFTTDPFSVGDKIFIEGVENEYGNTFNSADNGYKFFTVTNNYTTKPSALTQNPYQLEFNILDIANNPGLAKTSQSFASIINYNKYPRFETTEVASTFSEGEEILVKVDNVFQHVGLKLDKIANDYIKLSGKFDLKLNDKIKGTYTGTLATINTLYNNTGEFKVDYSSEKTKGWFTNTGKLDEDYQVIPDNDYYQTLSYTIQSPIEYQKLVSPVNRLLHTTGLKNFADTGISSTTKSGLGTAADVTTITRDLQSNNRVDVINAFDRVTDVDILTNPRRSKFIRFDTKELVNYFKCSTNRVLGIDNINTLFSNASNNAKTDGKIELTNSYTRFLIQAKNPANDNIQVSEILTLADFSTKNVYTIQKGSFVGFGATNAFLGSDLVDIVGDVDYNDIYSLKFTPADVYNTDLDIKIFQNNITGTGIGTTTIGFVDITGFSESVAKGTAVGPTTTTLASGNIGNVDAYFASVELHNTFAGKSKIVELYVTHDGSNSFISRYDFDTNTSDAIGTFTSGIDGGILSLKYENDSTTDAVSVKSKIVGIGTTTAGIGTYRFKTTAQPDGSEESGRIQSSYKNITASAGISTILEFTAEDVSSASNLVRIGIGSTSAIRQVLMSHNGEDAFVLEYPYVSIGAEQHDESWSGIGTFYSQLKGTDFELVFVPDAKFVGTSCQIQVYSEVINSGLDLINVAPDHQYGPSIDSLSLLQYNALNLSRSDNTNFVLNHESKPIFGRYFDPADTDNLTASTGTFTLLNNFFNRDERLVYTPGSSVQGIGTGALLMSDGNPLPSQVYVVSSDVNSDSFQLSLTKGGAAVTFIGVGTGNYHHLEMHKKNEKALITLDNIIQAPIAYTPTTTTLSGNVGGQVSISTSVITLAGISSILLNDILKIDDEYVKVNNVGLGTTNVGPISATGTLDIVEVDRGFIGSAASTHSDGSTVRLYKGGYNIVKDRIYFSEAPRGTNITEKNLSNRDAGRSSFSGRVYLRQDYSTNAVYDDISHGFTGIAQTFTTLVGGANTSGITTAVGIATGSSFVIINGIFQRPTTAENPLNNYDFVYNSLAGVSTVGVTSYVFSGITSTNGNLIIRNDTINQNQLPRAGQIISIGSSGGLGIAPLVGASVTAVTNSTGTITSVGIGSTDFHGSGYTGTTVSIGVTDVAYIHRFVSAGVNSITVNPNGIGAYSTFTPTDASFESSSGRLTLTKESHSLLTSDTYTATTGTFYNGTVGILTVKLSASPSPALANGQLVNIATNALTFTCAEDSNASNHVYPRPTDYLNGKWVPISNVAGGDTFEITVLDSIPSTNQTTHAFVSGITNGINRSANTVGIATGSIGFKCSSDYYQSTQYYPRTTDEANGAWLPILLADANSITVGVGSAGGGGTGAVITGTIVQGNIHTYVSGVSSSLLMNDTTYYSPYSIGGLGNAYDPVSGIMTVTVDAPHGLSGPGLQTATNAVYNGTVGILTITTNGAHGYNTGDYVKIAEKSIVFKCAQDNNSSTHPYPRSTDPIFNKWVQITKKTSTQFSIQVLDSVPSTNTTDHTFVSGTTSGILKANSTVGIGTSAFTFTCTQDSNVSLHSYPRPNKENPGSDPAYNATLGVESVGTTTSFTLNVGKSPAGSGGALNFSISDGGKGYVNPRLITPSPAYENLNVLGLSRIGLGETTETGNALRMTVNIGASSTTGIGSISYEVKSFDITQEGFGYREGDVFTPLGIVTDRYFSSLLTPLEFTVDQIFTDRFASWNVGEFDYIDSIANLQDGKRTRFPLNYAGELVSFQKDDTTDLDIQSLLLIFINGVLQNPGDAYTFNGGTTFAFTEAPDAGDAVSIFFYKGTSGVDVTYTDVTESIKAGDQVQVLKQNYLTGSSNQDMRTISGITTSDTVETNLYFGKGIDDTNLRPMKWFKQKVDKMINGNVVYKSRPSIEPLVFPNARVIGDLTTGDSECFVDSTELFDYEGTGDTDLIIVNESQTLTGAAITAVVSATGTISALTIVDGGSGYDSSSGIAYTVPLSIAGPRVATIPTNTVPSPPGIVATGIASIYAGVVTTTEITNAGLGYTVPAEPEVIIKLPIIPKEIVTGIAPAAIQGFSGIITGIGTTFGSGGQGTKAIRFFCEKTSGDWTTLINGYPIYVYDTAIGSGVTSIDGTAPGGNAAVVGIGTTYLNNVYQVRAINRTGTKADFIADVDSNATLFSTDSVGIGTTGVGSGKYSWGRLSGFSRSSNPISIGVTGKTVNSGLTTFPRVQRRNSGLRDTGALNKPS